MQPDLTLAKLSLLESADYVVRQPGFSLILTALSRNLHGQRNRDAPRPFAMTDFKVQLVPTKRHRYASRHREWRASRSFPRPRLPNATKSNSAGAQQRRAPDLRPFSGPGRFSVQRSREVSPAAQPLCLPIAGAPDANASQDRQSERGRHCYPVLTGILVPPIGLPEKARWATPGSR